MKDESMVIVLKNIIKIKENAYEDGFTKGVDAGLLLGVQQGRAQVKKEIYDEAQELTKTILKCEFSDGNES